MAQGYVTMESKGRELFGGLAMRSFFQDLEKDDMDSTIISCKMHDIVHGFAQFLTRNECYSIDQHKDKVGIKNLRHLSWQETGRNMNLTSSICDIGKLRSFFAECLSPEQLTHDLFNGLKSVRVLRLHGCGLQELPKKIGKLLHLRLPEGIGNLRKLRYIDLSWSKVEELPDAIPSLSNLQTLDLERCEQFSKLPDNIGDLILEICEGLIRLPEGIGNLLELRLPKGIGNLINLRHLNIRGTNRLEMMPQGIAKLTQLCSLSEFKVGKESSKLGYMEKLNQLKGELSIFFLCDLNNAADVEEAEIAELRNKKHIKELRLDFSRESMWE
nr:putative disease resistance protein RGA3 [Ipomoea batatas]